MIEEIIAEFPTPVTPSRALAEHFAEHVKGYWTEKGRITSTRIEVHPYNESSGTIIAVIEPTEQPVKQTSRQVITGRDIHEAFCATKPESQRKPWEVLDEHDQELYNAVAQLVIQPVTSTQQPLQGYVLKVLQDKLNELRQKKLTGIVPEHLEIAIEGAIETVNDLKDQFEYKWPSAPQTNLKPNSQIQQFRTAARPLVVEITKYAGDQQLKKPLAAICRQAEQQITDLEQKNKVLQHWLWQWLAFSGQQSFENWLLEDQREDYEVLRGATEMALKEQQGPEPEVFNDKEAMKG
jgi:hypothetical protein